MRDEIVILREHYNLSSWKDENGSEILLKIVNLVVLCCSSEPISLVSEVFFFV